VRIGASCLLLSVAIGLAACARTNGSRPAAGEEDTARALTPAEIAERSTPAIVSVHTEGGLGTGFVLREDGWIVTNLHVVAGHDEVMVLLSDGTRFPVVEVVNASPQHDLVILRVKADKLPVLTLGDSDSVRPGDPIVAIGHPLGLEDTISNGLVSAIRKVQQDLVVLQISAPIAPGSSGGPLFNERGEVIGVATAILRGGQNLNLGLPANYVHALARTPDPISLAELSRALRLLAREQERENARDEPERKVPKHALSLVSGCDDKAMALLGAGISGAIEVGAPLYNQGNFSACYHVYEGAAQDIERRLPKRCSGPKRALAEGRARAAKLDDPSAQAWAMRDAFDGLIDVMKRKSTKDAGD
jgi:serine protease Do